MSKHLTKPDLFYPDIVASYPDQSLIHFLSQQMIFVLIDVSFIVEMFQLVLFVLEKDSCGSFCVHCLNDFGVCAL